MKEEIKEASDGTLEQGDFKIKKKPKKLANKKPTKATKLDLSKKEEPKKEEKDTIPVIETNEVSVVESSENNVKVDEPVRVDTPQDEVNKEEMQKPQIEEITEIEVKDTKQPVEEEVVKEVVKQDRVLPENIEKLISFMEDTGGTVEDYVRINADYTNIDENVLLREYYKNVKPHLNSEEIDFILEDSFSWDEDLDEDRHIKKKKLAYKEEIAKARNFLEDTKSKYYDEIKLRPSQTQEQKKATEFFNRYNTEQQRANELHKEFVNKTNKLFNEFEGFDFNVGEKKFRYKINNTAEVAKSQSNINNFVGKFLNEDGSVKDHANYHKAIYAARNVDSIAEHFYEQGKADAIRDVNAKSKNIDITPAKQADGDIFIGGMKVKAVSGVDSSKLKIKTRNKN